MTMISANTQTGTARRTAPRGLSSLLLLALTVQLSIVMLEWAGPGSSDTRTRLATTMVAAANQGVFTELRVAAPAYSPSRTTPEVIFAAAPLGVTEGRADLAGPLAERLADQLAGPVHWVSAIPPPAC